MPAKISSGCLAVQLAATLAVNAGSAYLPITGPTPLRFEVAMTRPFDFSSAASALVLPPKLEAGPVSTDPALAATNANTVVSMPTENGGVLAVVMPATPTETTPPPAPFIAPHPADNLLIITPQMLADYFKPSPNATNAAGVSVVMPMPVGFTPPTEKNLPPSRATYKVQ